MAPGVKPYELPGDEYDLVILGTKIVSVSGRTKDFKRIDKITGKQIYPKSIEDCTVKYTYPTPVNRPGQPGFESNCNSEHGNSGGSILRVTADKVILVGVTMGGINEKKRNNDNSYQENVWGNFHVPLANEFLDALKKMLQRP